MRALRALRRFFGAALATRTARISLALAILFAGALCALRGFDALNYYSSLAIAFLGSVLAGLIGVAEAHRARAAQDALALPWGVFGAAARGVVPLVLAPLALLLLNALRVKNCDPLEGIAFYLMGPAASMLFASQLGAALGLVGRRAWVGPTLWIAVWLAWMIRDAAHLYFHPPIFAYNPFIGFFSGAIYDDLIELDARLGLFRLANALQVSLVWAAARMAWSPGETRLRLSALAGAGARAWAVALLLALAVGAMVGLRGAIGYEITREHIQAALGGRIEDERLTIYFDRATYPDAKARRLLEDHAYRLQQLESLLGDRYPHRIVSYVYRDDGQKRRLMGAQRVRIAKPWLHEIHLSKAAYGQPVVGHELAHVVLGQYAPGPLNIPTAYGVLPHAALVEGAAEALEWSAGRLTPHQWAAAMRAEGLAPPLAEIMGPEGFFKQAAGKAYTLAGSFVRWLLDSYGPAPLKRAYGDADLALAYGLPLPALVARWEAFLDGLVLPPGARELARERFDRKGIMMRVCPLEIPRLEAEASRQLAAGDVEGALATFRRVVGFIPDAPRKRIPLVTLLSRQGRADAAVAEAQAVLAMEGAPSATRAYVQELAADALWRAGRLDEARAAYTPVVALAQEEARLRTVRVKMAILDRREREPILGPYLLGRDDEDAVEYLTGAVADLPGDPLALYLLARRLHHAERYAEAAQVMGRAITGYDADARPVAVLIRREAWRMLGRSLFFSDQLEPAVRAFERAAQLAADEGDRLIQRDWAARARWVAGRRGAPKN